MDPGIELDLRINHKPLALAQNVRVAVCEGMRYRKATRIRTSFRLYYSRTLRLLNDLDCANID